MSSCYDIHNRAPRIRKRIFHSGMYENSIVVFIERSRGCRWFERDNGFMATSVFDVKDNNRALLHSTTNANESFNNQLKNEQQIKRLKLSTLIDRLTQQQQLQATQLSGTHTGVRLQYRNAPSTPKSSQRPPQSAQEAQEQRAMAKRLARPRAAGRASGLRLPYVDVRSEGAVMALVAALAFNDLSQHDTTAPHNNTENDDDDDNNINNNAKPRLQTSSTTNAVLTCAMTIVDQLRSRVSTAQRRATLLAAIASWTKTRSLDQNQLQQLVFSFVVNNNSRQPVPDGAVLFTKEQLIFSSIGTNTNKTSLY